MKKKNKTILTFFILAVLFVFSCENDAKKEKGNSKNEIQKLEMIKKQKQAESDSLKREIEKLKKQRDSLNSLDR
ncbi:hypothetical protein ABRY23_10815 [Melioribacteraceae bacterium 4301-Me]|uniref:hypothetical protein n=1 Tax=Pyranulibacter aquaticus TaxID=3163344 RepID=UPI00359ADECD